MKSILIVTGSLPPDVCGVGDYTQLLIDELKKRVETVIAFHRRDWSLRLLMQYAREIRRSHAKVVNIQYPTRGYGRSIVPHLLCLMTMPVPRVVTLHEFSRGSMAGRMAMCVFLLTADRVIFTTEYERQLACKFVPWLKKKSVVIHIGSNIPFLSSPSRDIDVAYFGRICPMKGLEEFGAAIRKVNQDRKWKVLVIGHIAEGYEEYGASICKELEAVGAEVVLNGKASEVARLLSGVRIALLPFPDGMSLRRGSALAAMGNGALLLTTPSVSDASVLEGKCLIAEGAAELHETLTLALSNYSSYDRVRMAGQEFAQSCSWNAIASAYLDTINAMI